MFHYLTFFTLFQLHLQRPYLFYIKGFFQLHFAFIFWCIQVEKSKVSHNQLFQMHKIFISLSFISLIFSCLNFPMFHLTLMVMLCTVSRCLTIPEVFLLKERYLSQCLHWTFTVLPLSWTSAKWSQARDRLGPL